MFSGGAQRGTTGPDVHGYSAAPASVNFNLSVGKLDRGADYVVSLGGEVDLYTAPELKQELHRLVGEGAKRLIVDMSETTFVDSTTLGVLLSVVKRVRPEGGAVVLVCPDRNVKRIFEITLLDRVFVIVDTRDEALAEFVASASA
jgi:anti-sigma B factor antagonist